MPSTRKRARAADPLEDENRSEHDTPKAAKLVKSSDVRTYLLSKPANGSYEQVSKLDATNKKATTTQNANKSSKKAADPLKAAKKIYETTLKSIDKKYNELQKRMKPNPTIWSGVTADDFSKAIAKFLPTVQTILGDSHNHA